MKPRDRSSIHDAAGAVLVEWAQRQVFFREFVRADSAAHIKATVDGLFQADRGELVFRDAEAMR